jgi:hypothetical protein
MKRIQSPTSKMIFILLIFLAVTLHACNFPKPPFPEGVVATLAATAMNPPTIPARETDQPGESPKDTAAVMKSSSTPAKYTLEIETYGADSLEGLIMTHGPFKISIPLEKSSSGLAGHATGKIKETCTGVLAGERTTERNLDVTASGHDPLTFTIAWNDTFVSETGECFISIERTEVKSVSTVELPARDGASKKLEHPSTLGQGYEIYTLHME